MHPNLSFEQAPPISVPYRFFLTAPWFGVAAGLVLLLGGGEVLASRWTMSALAATHLLVVGFMLQAMCGALLQFVPVAAGGNIWRPRLVANLVHPLLLAAAIMLVTAFLSQRTFLFIAAAHGFVLGLGFYGMLVSVALWRTPAHGGTIVALRIALIGLLVTLALGVLLATGIARGEAWPLLTLTDVHAAWGLGGWALMLLAGVSYFVVPMFQLTPPYPQWVARSVPPALLALLLLWTVVLLGLDERGRPAVFLGGLGVAALFATTTLHLQYRRRRKVSDTTLLFFRTAMLSLLAVLLSALLFAVFPGLETDPRAAVWLGVLVLVGVFVSAITGMLYKIVPFLNWLHLQRLCGLNTLPPTMNQMIAETSMRRQFHVHLAALALLLGSVWAVELTRLAGAVFALDCAWLGANLIAAVRAYARFRNRILAAA
ncbi:MAG: hypothetical protein AB1642_03535 [Pseudomonadota bacterium]